MRLLAWIAVSLLAGRVQAQEEAFPVPPAAPAVKTLLEQPYLTDAERSRLRVRHGVWTDEDLLDPALRAAAALTTDRLDDAALDDIEVSAEDRGEAMIRRGQPERALSVLEGRENTRARRLRGQALLDLGRPGDAARELEVAGGTLLTSPDADEVAEAARALMLLARLRGPKGEGVVGYQQLLNALARARDDLDRLSVPVLLAEAELLYEKDKYADAGAAVESLLSLNPRCAQAWVLLGRAAVDGFDFPRARSIALRLEELAGGPTPESVSIRALALIRQGEGEAAERELAQALEKYPDHRGLRSLWAGAAAVRFDFVAADARLKALDELAPETAWGAMDVGRALGWARQYEEAGTYLRTAVARAPHWAAPAVELGFSAMQAGRLDEAQAVLERAVELDPYNVRSANSLTLLRELRTYETLQTEHFIIRYKAGDDHVLAQEMPEVLERIHARVTGGEAGGIDHVPAHKTVVELYPDHHWFSVRLTGLPRLHTIAAATGPVIAMEAPRLGPGHKVGPYDWPRVLQHEFVHTVTLSRTRNRLPHWFTEAAAVYLEDSPRSYETVQMLADAYENDALFDLDAINAAFVRPRRPTDRGLAYAQGHWMYEYIIERYGARAPLELMDRYASGQREAGAFGEVLGVTREEFLAAFKSWARGQLLAWGMLATDEKPDVSAFMARDGVDKPGEADIRRWLDEQPDNPFLLEAAVAAVGERGISGPDDISLCERYARARPVDPLPHKLLAAAYLSGSGGGTGPEGAIPHLEFLDAREQSSPGFAIELARRYMAIGQGGKALAKAARATRIAPYDPSVREHAAAIAIRAGDLRTAERHIEALVVLEPDRELHRRRLEALRAMMADQTAR
jgi:tetratricopeptide (TPR) repeat protein